MVMDTEVMEDAPESPEATPVVNDELGGMDLLRSAFGTPSESLTPEPAQEDDVAQASVGEEAGAPAEEAPAELRDEDIGRVFQDPKVVRMLQEAQGRAMAQARQLWEMELQAARQEEENLLLDDEEVGRRVRAQQQMAPILNQARAEGYSRAQQEFVSNGLGDLWQKVPELRELDTDTKRKYDPTLPTWKTMGEYLNAVIDVAANKRSEKLAEKKARELAKAMTTNELNKFRQGQPNPTGVPGHGREVGKIVDVDSMTGKDILKSAFGN